ncbi:MAG: nucleotide exchange factor GrpE [Rhodospirillaceae bacterium]|nr:nucleotide exchange factor GrpE [Rhodospirillaceae bacterium]
MADDKNGRPDGAPEEPQAGGAPSAERAGAPEAGPGPGGAPGAEEGAGPTGAAAPSLEESLAAARAEAELYKDQALRALAEVENARRRHQREREDMQRYAIADFVKEILPVVDNLRRALDAIPAEARAGDRFLESLATGVEMTERQLLGAFERFRVSRIDPQPGERFDAARHQAMFEVPDSGHPSGTVVQVVQPGYMLHDRLLRPALVGVAKAGAPEPAKGDGQDPYRRVDTLA